MQKEILWNNVANTKLEKIRAHINTDTMDQETINQDLQNLQELQSEDQKWKGIGRLNQLTNNHREQIATQKEILLNEQKKPSANYKQAQQLESKISEAKGKLNRKEERQGDLIKNLNFAQLVEDANKEIVGEAKDAIELDNIAVNNAGASQPGVDLAPKVDLEEEEDLELKGLFEEVEEVEEAPPGVDLAEEEAPPPIPGAAPGGPPIIPPPIDLPPPLAPAGPILPLNLTSGSTPPDKTLSAQEALLKLKEFLEYIENKKPESGKYYKGQIDPNDYNLVLNDYDDAQKVLLTFLEALNQGLEITDKARKFKALDEAIIKINLQKDPIYQEVCNHIQNQFLISTRRGNVSHYETKAHQYKGDVSRYLALINYIKNTSTLDPIVLKDFRDRCIKMREYLTKRQEMGAKNPYKLNKQIEEGITGINNLLDEKTGKLRTEFVNKPHQYRVENSLEEKIALDAETSSNEKVRDFLSNKGLAVGGVAPITLPRLEGDVHDLPTKAVPTLHELSEGKVVAFASDVAQTGIVNRLKSTNHGNIFVAECYFANFSTTPPNLSTSRHFFPSLPSVQAFAMAKTIIDNLQNPYPDRPLKIKGNFDPNVVEAMLIYAGYLNKYEKLAHPILLQDASFGKPDPTDKQIDGFKKLMQKPEYSASTSLFASTGKTAEALKDKTYNYYNKMTKGS